MSLPKYTIGVGDRFGQEAGAQLRACMLAAQAGIDVSPVWNKSNREHLIVGSDPSQTRAAADAAVREAGWTAPYFVDADHIRMDTFARYIEPCNFFTIDVADQIGQPADPADVEAFLGRHPELGREPHVEEASGRALIKAEAVSETARHFLRAVAEAGKVYRAIRAAKGTEEFVVEVSMDETANPQTPTELLVILAAIADEGIPLETIAPKFTGRFNKGVDFVGDVAQFAVEFRNDLATIAHAIQRYGLPSTLKLSVHSGSDKYSIYPAMHEALQESGAGLHLKTAGTTWLEEIIGLAAAGGDGLALAQDIYAEAYTEADELCAPYSSVIEINRAHLPLPHMVAHWTGEEFVAALRHLSPGEAQNPAYNPHFRQLLHVGFKVAARMCGRFTQALQDHREIIQRNVTQNLFERHIRPVFLGT